MLPKWVEWQTMNSPCSYQGKLRLARAVANGDNWWQIAQLYGDNCGDTVLFIEISLYEIQDTVFCTVIKYQLSYIYSWISSFLLRILLTFDIFCMGQYVANKLLSIILQNKWNHSREKINYINLSLTNIWLIEILKFWY